MADSQGIFVRAGGYVARPGAVRGYSHAMDISDGGGRSCHPAYAKYGLNRLVT
jgi:hypothetical protein